MQPNTLDWSTLIKLLKQHAAGVQLALQASRSYQFEPSPESYMEFLRQVANAGQLWLQLLQLIYGLEPLPPSLSKPTMEPPTL